MEMFKEFKKYTLLKDKIYPLVLELVHIYVIIL